MPSHRLIVSICFPFRELKNVPDKIVKDGYFRGATLFQGLTPALCEIPATDVCPTSQATWKSFHRALSGPFNNLRPAGFSLPRLPVSASIIFISASTVCFLSCDYHNTPFISCQALFIHFLRKSVFTTGNMITLRM